jgi:hypothetical protein
MHLLFHAGMMIVLIIACALVTLRFFSWQIGFPFVWSKNMWRSRYFWLGIAVALVFLWSDYRFERYFSLAAKNIL